VSLVRFRSTRRRPAVEILSSVADRFDCFFFSSDSSRPAIWISLAGTISAILSLLVGAARDQETDGLENSGTTRNVATGEAGAAVASRKRGRFKRAHSGHVYEL